jgi:hypothetical protein
MPSSKIGFAAGKNADEKMQKANRSKTKTSGGSYNLWFKTVMFTGSKSKGIPAM